MLDEESNGLSVVISSNVATIEGTVRNDRQQLMPGSLVVLVPDRNRDRTELFRSATTDNTGHFSLPNIAPGDYKAFAWEAPQPYVYFDPEILRPVESKGKPIQLRESSRQSVDLTSIPAN